MCYIMKNNLLDQLIELRESDYYPFHMPGHKRKPMRELPVTSLDITEIDDFDNLYVAEGILKQIMERAARVYGSKKALLGVNGSTGNLLAAISAAFCPGDSVLVARNCHKAVYHALELRGLKPIFLYPETDSQYSMCKGITAREVKACLEKHEVMQEGKTSPIAGMILTSPTYEGIVSEVGEIATLLHERGAVLIVDEAHGAHLGFHPAFPVSAISQEADLVIQSLHKTLPAVTQTSLLHIVTDRVEESVVHKFFGMYQTSSPSYILMASIDECLAVLERDATDLFDNYVLLLEDFYREMKTLSVLRIAGGPGKDPGKIMITVPEGISALQLYDVLRNEYHLQPEMCGLHHVLMMTSVYDSKEGFERLKSALREIDETYRNTEMQQTAAGDLQKDKTDETAHLTAINAIQPKQCMRPCETERAQKEYIPLYDCAGRISAEYLYLYPPGVPYIIPGEEVPDELPEALELLQKKGYRLLGNEREKSLLVMCSPKGKQGTPKVHF